MVGPQEAEDPKGKSPVSAARNCMNYVIDLDGVPRESPEHTSLPAKIEASQNVLRICTPQRVHDLLQGSRMELDAEQIVARLNRLRSDMDFGSSVHEEYSSLAQLHEIQELIVCRDRAKLKAFLRV